MEVRVQSLPRDKEHLCFIKKVLIDGGKGIVTTPDKDHLPFIKKVLIDGGKDIVTTPDQEPSPLYQKGPH